MNHPVDPVTPEVAFSEIPGVKNLPGMSELVANFMQLAQSLQKHGISSGIGEIQEQQLGIYQSREAGSYAAIHGRRAQSPCSGAYSSPESRAFEALHTPRSVSASPSVSEGAREEARHLLHAVLSQATAKLHLSLSSKNGRLRSPQTPPDQPYCSHACPSEDLQSLVKPLSTVSTEITHSRTDSPDIGQAGAAGEFDAQIDDTTAVNPTLVDLHTPFSEGIHHQMNPGSAHPSHIRAPVRSYRQGHTLQMLDVTRTSIVKDKERKSGASAVTQYVHAEQGCEFLGPCTWDNSPRRRPANTDVLHGYRSQYERPGRGAAAPSPNSAASWVPGGRNKQTFNKFAAEQAIIASAQKSSTGCFSGRSAPLISTALAGRHDRKHASSRLVTVPGAASRASRLPSAADALRAKPRCHRAFVFSPSPSIGSSAHTLHTPDASPRQPPHLDLTCPRNRLRYDAHVVCEEGHTSIKQVWGATSRSMSSSGTFSAAGATIKPNCDLSMTAATLSSRDEKKDHVRTSQSVSHAPSRWDPCSSLDASRLEHLRSCDHEASLTGIVEFHSPCENVDTPVQWHNWDAVRDEPVGTRNDDLQLVDAPASLAYHTSPVSPEATNAEEDQLDSSEVLTAGASEKDALAVESSGDVAPNTEQTTDVQHHTVEGPGLDSSADHACSQCLSSPATPSQMQSYRGGDANPPAEISEHGDDEGVQLHLNQAYALIDFVSLSVEELQRQLRCACVAHVCTPDCERKKAAPHEEYVASLGMRPASAPEIAGQASEARSEFLVNKASVLDQIQEIRHSMLQLQSAHLHAMEESARSTLGARTGDLAKMETQHVTH